MAQPKTPLKHLLKGWFGWDFLLTLRKPSAFLLVAVPLLAAARSIAAQLGHQFDLPIRTQITVIGSVLVLVAYLLVQAACPKTMRKIRSKQVLEDGAGLQELAATVQEDIDKSKLSEADVNRTLVSLLETVAPKVDVPEGQSRGSLFAALSKIKSTPANLERFMTHAHGLFVRTMTPLRLAIGALVVIGMGMLAFNFAWALWILFKPMEAPNGMG